jgi:hypothetical protein
MTALGPNGSKGSSTTVTKPEIVLNKRCKSNKGFRQGLTGQTDIDIKQKDIRQKLHKYQEDSPTRSPPYKAQLEDVFNSRHLVEKITGKIERDAEILRRHTYAKQLEFEDRSEMDHEEG